jgi:hypothetical protein
MYVSTGSTLHHVQLSDDFTVEARLKEKHEYVGILRCRTWHTWPAPVVVEHKSLRFSNESTVIRGRIAVLSYAQRATPELYPEEETKKGPLLWDGKVKDLHTVRDVIFAAPQDQFPVSFQHRHAYRGEVDVCINFILEHPITQSVAEAVKAFVYAEMAMLNLQLGENLVPTVPFQISHVLGNGERSLDNTVFFNNAVRKELQQAEIETALQDFVRLLSHKEVGRHAIVALELYAAHFSEKHARVRFLLLVIALEAIAAPTLKHKVALDCLNRWEEELAEQLALHSPSSDEYDSLEALRHGLRFQRTDSIRSRVQNLFTHLANSPDEVQVLRKRAREVYDKRSTLVHEGRLPDDELADLENNARGLVEIVFNEMVSTVTKA